MTQAPRGILVPECRRHFELFHSNGGMVTLANLAKKSRDVPDLGPVGSGCRPKTGGRISTEPAGYAIRSFQSQAFNFYLFHAQIRGSCSHFLLTYISYLAPAGNFKVGKKKLREKSSDFGNFSGNFLKIIWQHCPQAGFPLMER